MFCVCVCMCVSNQETTQGRKRKRLNTILKNKEGEGALTRATEVELSTVSLGYTPFFQSANL